MSKHRHYPYVGPWHSDSTKVCVLMHDTPCGQCGKKLGKGAEFMRRDTQVSWFRGEDEVEAVHLGCFDAYKEKVTVQ